MKQIYIIFIAIFFINSISFANLQTDDIDKIIKKLAGEIANSINSSKIPGDAKIAVTFFSRIDGERTKLGIKFSNKLYIQLLAIKQKGKISQTILFPNNVDKYLDEMMYDYFVVPEGKDEGEYWTKFLNDNTPEFYINGKYELNSSYNEINFSEFIVKPDKYSKYKNIACVIRKDINEKINNKVLIDRIKINDIPINKPNLYYEQLIKIKDNPNGFSLQVNNESTGKPVNDFNFVVGNSYSISLEMYKDLYIYAFFYDPKDYSTSFMTMAFPYDEDSKKTTYLNTGKHTLPGEGIEFEIEPPYSPIYIKILGFKNKPNLEFEFQKAGEYYITVFNHENCRKFVKQIKEINKDEVYCRSLNFSRSRD